MVVSASTNSITATHQKEEPIPAKPASRVQKIQNLFTASLNYASQHKGKIALVGLAAAAAAIGYGAYALYGVPFAPPASTSTGFTPPARTTIWLNPPCPPTPLNGFKNSTINQAMDTSHQEIPSVPETGILLTSVYWLKICQALAIITAWLLTKQPIPPAANPRRASEKFSGTDFLSDNFRKI